ncbi:hypothetical protein GCM10007913_16240 [Devosia yakushimensis]|uniref:Suppressor of fused protein (SUFU) n=1 Tax=Devosia yakushimensis TaxID=470028 RepID=A0ABQ5UC59_9HYPH|nr:hypothetical protein [Devosia yakushimensis]GLQ09692.1 hypothetical protein GCM10007913_16240 [Devosia yakushimensis]
MGLFDKLRELLTGQTGKGASKPVAAEPAPAAMTPAASSVDNEQAFEETLRRRHEYWAGVGEVEDDVLTHLISPTFTGGPAWPSTRQAFRIVRRPHGIVLATDGLSDPFDGVAGAGNGFELELFVETADIDPDLAGAAGDVGGLSKSWAFELLNQVAGTIAGAGGISGQLARYKVLSMEIPGVSRSYAIAAQLPPGFTTDDDSVGVLIGAPEPDFPTRIDDTPLSPVTIVPLVLLRAEELQQLRQGGAEARQALAARLAASPTRHRSSLTRPALI